MSFISRNMKTYKENKKCPKATEHENFSTEVNLTWRIWEKQDRVSVREQDKNEGGTKVEESGYPSGRYRIVLLYV